MRKIIILVAILVATIGASAAAQGSTQLPNTPNPQATYQVVKGTTLWDLAHEMYGRGSEWGRLFDNNVEAGYLMPNRLHYAADGTPIVILRIGQKLILDRSAANQAVELVEQMPMPAPATAGIQTINATTPWWLWALLGLAVLTMIYSIMRRKLSDPIGSGPAIVSGGLNDSSAPEYFRHRTSLMRDIPAEQIRILSIRRGRGFGLMRVSYLRGRQETKRLNGEIVYQALVELPNGVQEKMYALEACGNDLRFAGTRYFANRLFRFEPNGASIYTPPQETVAHAGNTDVVVTDEEITVTESGRTVTFGADGWILKQGPDGGVIVGGEGRSDVEFRGGRVYGAKLPDPAIEPTPTPKHRVRVAPSSEE